MSPTIDTGLAPDRWMHFDGPVPQHFDEHVRKSIPNYERVMAKIGFVSQFFVENGSRCLDVGSSTGRTVTEVAHANHGKQVTIDLVDASPAMVAWLQSRFPGNPDRGLRCNVFKMDITQFKPVTSYDLVVASLVIQFVKRDLRPQVLRYLYEGLNPGGGFLWFEKCAEESSLASEIMKQYVNHYKVQSGLSPESVLNKDDVLRGIMPLRLYEDNVAMLQAAGFREIAVIDKDMNFTLFLAIR